MTASVILLTDDILHLQGLRGFGNAATKKNIFTSPTHQTKEKLIFNPPAAMQVMPIYAKARPTTYNKVLS